MKAKIEADAIQLDDAQLAIMEALDSLAKQLEPTSFITRFKHRLFGQLKGLYIWGGVGRGKTMLMDYFYESLTNTPKQRLHFHRFMLMVHESLTERQGQRSPLKAIAKEVASKTKVLCFDEFYVSDIADAMILANLFEALFKAGVLLVATSNVEPKQLYRNGLQRNKFLPTIELIERHTQVLFMGDGEDYRLRTLMQAQIYHTPLDDKAEQILGQTFAKLCPESAFNQQALIIEHRSIPVINIADGIVWFDFEHLCGGPRSVKEFIEIARMYNTVLVSNVPVLDSARDDAAKRFVIMVDEFYERQVKLIMSAQVGIEQLYQGRLLKFEFERTKSRLIEMQSQAYLEQPHKA